jgi:hypothetical protein
MPPNQVCTISMQSHYLSFHQCYRFYPCISPIPHIKKFHLKHPGLMPPTVAGPMMLTPLLLAFLMSDLVLFSGTPSAMIAIVLICGKSSASHTDEYTLLNDAKLINTSTSGQKCYMTSRVNRGWLPGCFLRALASLVYTGMLISFAPQ